MKKLSPILGTVAAAVAAMAACWAQPVAAQRAGPRPFSGGEAVWSAPIALRQHRLLEQSLAALQPQRPGVRDVYVLTAALWGEHVFESEASKAAAVLSERYSAAGRTIVLSNFNAAKSPAFPAATPNHIEAALARLGEVMDPREDLAIVFLTSHGQQNVGMSVVEPNRMEYRLQPHHLRTILDDAGLKTRVVILSACFSGQFIPALSDRGTLVLTAASASQPSFGCQPEREWTYFGDALFNTAMKTPGGLMSAFERAKAQILDWETRDKQQPSRPQAYVGPDAARVLAAIEAQGPSPAPSPAAGGR